MHRDIGAVESSMYARMPVEHWPWKALEGAEDFPGGEMDRRDMEVGGCVRWQTALARHLLAETPERVINEKQLYLDTY